MLFIAPSELKYASCSPVSTRRRKPVSRCVRCKNSAWLRASRTAAVATGITRRTPLALQNAANICSVSNARSIAAGVNWRVVAMPSLRRTRRLSSSVILNVLPGV